MRLYQIWPIVKGGATWIPFLYDAARGHTGGTMSARYCYGVWMRHLVRLASHGMNMRFNSVAELGPGDSLGIGLAALLSGASRLQAFDVVRYASNDHNQVILNELSALFRARATIPGSDELPGVFPRLESCAFPLHLWPDSVLDTLIDEKRVSAISAALRGAVDGPVRIDYVVPWQRIAEESKGSVDLAFSQAVLEHVNDLRPTYSALRDWLRPGAYMSHVVDFRSHHITPGWDGHLQYPRAVWRVVRGRRPYLLNRNSPAEHLGQLEETGFAVLHVDRDLREPTLTVNKLAPALRKRSELDRHTCTMHMLTRKPLLEEKAIP